ncbi:LysR substrate-binding domain-containing protein [Cochlodiniinecator piscidefendens]|uniref:LysR substrate-binding domain-containing protein n=1 Tax=Cochlodiniinecator piscidefendens TaxID=2715756 RepID=UPI00140E3834|nr:LysR substrate-binding domain-containing protein [Cochlodiniinecator piscidefendens]
MASLPSLPALRAFEAAARLGSFQEAAKDIGVSATAISHHIRGLEAHLKIQLFTRRTRQVFLTDEGERLASGVSEAFRILETSVNSVLQHQQKPKIRIALGPSFATRWLLPRFAAFCAQFPNVELELVQTPLLVSPQNVDADIFITWGDGDFPGMISEPLVNVLSAPVASPALLKQLGLPKIPGDLLKYPLIHQRDILGWEAWLAAAGVPTDSVLTGPVIEDTNVVLQAAISGQGVVMGWLPLVNSELESGALVQLFDATLSERRAYFLVRNKMNQNESEVEAICLWLTAQAKESQ